MNVGQRRFRDDDRGRDDHGLHVVGRDRGGRRRLVLLVLQAESQSRAGAGVRIVAAEPIVDNGAAADSLVRDISDGGDGARAEIGGARAEKKGKIAEKGAEEEEKIISRKIRYKCFDFLVPPVPVPPLHGLDV